MVFLCISILSLISLVFSLLKDGEKGVLVVLCQSWFGWLKPGIVSHHFSELSHVMYTLGQASYIVLTLLLFIFQKQVLLSVICSQPISSESRSPLAA